MQLSQAGGQFYAVVADGPPVNRHRPSVDVLFESAVERAGKDAPSIVHTGMGDDGARGLLEMRQAGSHTIAQDEDSCVVFGMPKEAIQRGAAVKIVPLNRVAHEIETYARLAPRTGPTS